jgi:hypothetical protein
VFLPQTNSFPAISPQSSWAVISNSWQHLSTVRDRVRVTLRLTVSQSVSLGVEPHLGLMIRYLLLFDNYSLVLWGALSDERTGLLLYTLLALANLVFLGSESLGARDHNLLSQIWDFPFRRLLRLAGSRCRYSNPTPHGWPLKRQPMSLYNPLECTTQKTQPLYCWEACLLIRCLVIDILLLSA